jgi:lipid II:glycine glycyltransferase (peptidoglycan interpeptide bridge formation enzyme)
VRSVSATAPIDWDSRTVNVPGGHVMQGTVWAEHRRAMGQEPLFVTFDDGRGALVVSRRQRPVGVFASARKGPVSAGDPPDRVAERALALTGLMRDRGASLLYVDPELDRSQAYAHAMDHGGFATTDPAEPSVHVMRLYFPASTREGALFESFGKSTRQRIRSAEKAGVTVRVDERGERLPAFAELLAVRSDELGVALRAEFGALPFSARLLAAGQGRLYLAEHEGEMLGGLLVYLQGGTLSTIYSADRADSRRTYPGSMHLLRWTAIRDALAMGAPWIDLGGVDLPGHRHPPRENEPSYGLYEHKRGFGAVWVEREQARRVILRPWHERAATASRSVSALARDGVGLARTGASVARRTAGLAGRRAAEAIRVRR